MSKDEIITKLVESILAKDECIKQLNERIDRAKQYLEVYEEYIQGESEPWQL